MRKLTVRFHAVIAGLAVVTMLGLAACGDDATETPAAETPITTASGSACKLVTLAEASQALGGATDLSVANDAEDGCAYETADGMKSVDLKVETLEYRADQADQIKSLLEPTATKPLTGMGDAAFSYQPADSVTQNYVWGKGKFLEIFVNNEGGKTVDAAMKLTQTAFSRL